MVLLHLCTHFQDLNCVCPTNVHVHSFACHNVRKYVTFNFSEDRTSTELVVGSIFFLQNICLRMHDCRKYEHYTPYILGAGTHSSVLGSMLRFQKIYIDSI